MELTIKLRHDPFAQPSQQIAICSATKIIVAIIIFPERGPEEPLELIKEIYSMISGSMSITSVRWEYDRSNPTYDMVEFLFNKLYPRRTTVQTIAATGNPFILVGMPTCLSQQAQDRLLAVLTQSSNIPYLSMDTPQHAKKLRNYIGNIMPTLNTSELEEVCRALVVNRRLFLQPDRER